MKLRKFTRGPEDVDDARGLELAMLGLMVLPTLAITAMLTSIFKWYLAAYIAILSTYAALAMFEVFGPKLHVPDKIAITQKGERVRAWIFVTISSLLLFGALSFVKIGRNLIESFSLLLIAAPFFLALIVRMKRANQITK